MRFDANGSLDSSFGGSGYVTTDLGANDTITDIALQADGKIVAVGNSDMIAFPAAMTASAGPAATPALRNDQRPFAQRTGGRAAQ